MALYSLGTSHVSLKHCELHSHNSWEIVLNVKGMGIALVGEMNYSFSPNTIMCIPPGIPHMKTSENGFYDIYFHTDTIFFAMQPSSGTGKKSAKALPLIMQDDAEQSFQSILSLMLRLHYQTPKHEAVLLSLHNAALQLLNLWADRDLTDPVIAYIQSRLISSFTDPEINITSILLESGYTKDYIRRRFHKELGVTPNEYVTNLRINYARQLLSQKEILKLNVADVSSMCGYYDAAYFSRIFRKKIGIPPGSY
ncbi:MAG: AraC family transcriptional regulator [Lachnospiraceae bacterium]|jgi:AraC-like DNA-binding protein|nr:AraC family transcriptional regulator [Lachnospiraceae bacterium]MDE7046942.1 AraC family transcriptional regulator [Lachnospiraceae bacterium]